MIGSPLIQRPSVPFVPGTAAPAVPGGQPPDARARLAQALLAQQGQGQPPMQQPPAYAPPTMPPRINPPMQRQPLRPTLPGGGGNMFGRAPGAVPRQNPGIRPLRPLGAGGPKPIIGG